MSNLTPTFVFTIMAIIMDIKTAETTHDRNKSIFSTTEVIFVNMDYPGLVEYAEKAATGGVIRMGFKPTAGRIACKGNKKTPRMNLKKCLFGSGICRAGEVVFCPTENTRGLELVTIISTLKKMLRQPRDDVSLLHRNFYETRKSKVFTIFKSKILFEFLNQQAT